MSFPLNEPQQAAATHRDGPLLVFAGAGSGKTRVITQRIANLVNGGAEPHRVCAVTFTNKAAGEMRDRLETMLQADLAKRVTISTFHALCVRLLREEGPLAWTGRSRGFVIYDERDAGTLLATCLGDELGDVEGEEGDRFDES
jgi:DNA helicase-2/ATP-dependent DNA helicase PcrA